MGELEPSQTSEQQQPNARYQLLRAPAGTALPEVLEGINALTPGP